MRQKINSKLNCFVIIIYTFPSTVALESYRQKVAAKHQETIRQHEQRLRQIQRERQAVFDDAFKSDLAEFKQKGTIPSESQTFFSLLFSLQIYNKKLQIN